MMLLLRALVIVGAVLAVLSCGNAFAAPLDPDGPPVSVGAADTTCNTALSYSWASDDSGAGTCL